MSDGDALIAACRRWAGFPLDQLCASCGNPFYCAAGLPVCFGCRRNHARQRLLAVLEQRALSRLLVLHGAIAEQAKPGFRARSEARLAVSE